MALIKCPSCGKNISDKAPYCPHCGLILSKQDAPGKSNLPDAPTMPSEIPENMEYTDPSIYDDNPEPRKDRRLILIVVIFLVLLAGGTTSYYFYAKKKAQTAAFAEKARLDSIAAVEAARLDSIAAVEAARLDSIRQDSIYRNFSTYDLAVFNLHGHVKSVKLIEGEIGMTTFEIFAEESKEDYYSFDVNGNCTTPKKRPDEYFLGFKYDKQGKIVGSRFVESGGCPTHEIKWDKNMRVIREFSSYGMHWIEYEYRYSETGDLLSVRIQEVGNQQFQDVKSVIFTILERDRWGNWTKRKASISGRSEHYDYESGRTISEPYSETRIDSRIIEYYDMKELSKE